MDATGHAQERTPTASADLLHKKKQLIRAYLGRGLVLSPAATRRIDSEEDVKLYLALLDRQTPTQEDVDRLALRLSPEHQTLRLQETEKQTGSEASAQILPRGRVRVVTDFPKDSRKRDVADFVSYFASRYQFLSKILRARQELHSSVAIGRLLSRAEREPVALIGCVYDVQETKNHNLMITVEDPTGKIQVLVSKSRNEVLDEAKNIVPDEIIGITGVMGRGIVYANSFIWPDVPLHKELRKAPEESYAIFLSDIHIGSADFLKEPFERFIAWLNGEIGTAEHKERIKKIKFAFIVGDMVDGVGIYPGQQAELQIEDIHQQYAEFTKYVKRFPSHIQIIICPGNHDAIRLAEPQPSLPVDMTEELRRLDNVTLVSNPAVIRIAEAEGFPGIDVLLYHGYSFDHYVAEVDHIRSQGGYDRADLVMKFLLRRRHLAPTHTSTVYEPTVPDPLLITEVPDIFCSGHIHKASASQYRNVTLLSGSCWQRTTAFQRKVGHHPEPARVPLVNLQTRKVKLLRFMDDE